MFALSLDTRIKKDILRILDNNTDFISTKSLVDQIGYANQYVVRKSLNELYEKIRINYLPEELSLKINKHQGVMLYSKDGNLYDLINTFISEDIAFRVLLDVIVHRTISSKLLCEKLFVSESSLRRRIREVNNDLDNYNIRMTFSQNIRLQGSEHMIRIIHFTLLFYIYRHINNVPSVEDPTIYKKMAAKVSSYLSLEATDRQQDILALFLYVIDYSVQMNNPLIYTTEELAFFSKIEFPDLPDFLSAWSLLDWQFLVFGIFIVDWPGLSLTLDLKEAMFFSKTEATEAWMVIFEDTFTSIQPESRDMIKEKVYKQLLTNSLFPLDDALFQVFHHVDYSSISDLYPIYIQRFEVFWQKFVTAYPVYDTLYSRQTNLLLIIYLVPLMDYFPEIKIYNDSHMTVTFNHFIEQRVISYFYSRYKIIFVDNIADAQIVIGTHVPNELTLNHDQPGIIIESTLSKCDLLRIEKAIERMISTRV